MSQRKPGSGLSRVVKTARRIPVPWKGRKFHYNSAPVVERGKIVVRPVQQLTRELLDKMYAEFVELDLEAYNETRKADGLPPLTRAKAVVEESAHYMPYFIDGTNANGYPREFTQGMYEFLTEFFLRSIAKATITVAGNRKAA